MSVRSALGGGATPRARREVSIRRALTLSFSAIIVLLATTLLLLALLDRRQARTDLSRALLQRALARTNGYLSELLAPVRRQLAIDWHEVRLGGVPRYDAAAHARHFLPSLIELPIIGSMMVADTAGHQLLLMRYDSTVIRSPLLEGQTDLPVPTVGTRQFFTRDFRPASRGERSVWQLWNASASRSVATWSVPLPDYDPRKREWHVQALLRLAKRSKAVSAVAMAPAVAWSDVYTLYTTREPGLSASFAAREPSGALVVIAYDLRLEEVSQYARAQAPTPNGRVFLVSDSGWVIGHPRDARFDDRATRAAFSMLPVERLRDPVTDAWAAAWRGRTADTETILPLTVGDRRWWAGFRAFDIEPGRRFWIGVVVPESEVRATVGSEGAGIVAATAIALLLAFWLAAGLARRVADPLAALAEQSARIARLDLATASPPPSRLREVRQLSATIEEMRRALEENFAERERTSRALAESESRLLQSQKLDAVGQLAGGIAHDFNNLLTAIRGYASLLRERFEPDDEGLDDVNEIDVAAQRAADLTSQLLAFSRRQHAEARIVDVNAVVTSAAKLLARLMGEQVTLETILEPGLPAVKIDPGQLHQVLVNLAVNARDAMPRGGRLSITTSQGGRIRALDGLTSGPGGTTNLPPVVISVVDTGVGMSSDVRARAFEPFFTTKELGRGTGLGLATCWGIVRDAGGILEIESAPGAGTVVQVILPSVITRAVPDRPDGRAAPAKAGGETVLVVEDEAQLRSLAERALTRGGFRVLAAADGIEALALLKTRETSVDLVITDVVMPRMGGPELARRIRERWPHARVLFMTGYAESDALGSGDLPASAAEVLRKPFTPTELVRAVRSAIEAMPVD